MVKPYRIHLLYGLTSIAPQPDKTRPDCADGLGARRSPERGMQWPPAGRPPPGAGSGLRVRGASGTVLRLWDSLVHRGGARTKPRARLRDRRTPAPFASSRRRRFSAAPARLSAVRRLGSTPYHSTHLHGRSRLSGGHDQRPPDATRATQVAARGSA